MEAMNIYVKGDPKAQPRAKGRLINSRFGKSFIQMYTPSVANEWKRAVTRAVESAWSVYTPDPRTGSRGPGVLKESLDGPLHLDLTFYLPRPQYLEGWKHTRDAIAHVGKPDFDNLSKAVADAMSESGIWKDDAQVCSWSGSKWYSAVGGASGCRIVVEVLTVETPTLFAAEAAETHKRVPTIRELIAKHQIPLPSESDSQLEIDRMTGKRISME